MKIGLENIVIRRLVGKEKIISYAELTDVWIDGNGNLEFYCGDKKVLTFPKTYPQDFLIEIMKIKKIKVKTKISINDFVLEQTLLNKVIVYIGAISSIVFIKMSLDINSLIAFSFSMLYTMIVIPASFGISKDIVIIKNKTITRKKLLRKTRSINFKDVRYIKMTDGDNAIVYIYSENGLEMKIPMVMKNMDMFEKVIEMQKWKIRK